MMTTMTAAALTLGAALTPAAALTTPAEATEPGRPNIVFILADDLGARDLSNEGSPYYESPRIDALARAGVKFERAYAASRVCSPSRASIMTGKTPPSHGITTWIGDDTGEAWSRRGLHDSHTPPDYERALPAGEITLAEALRDAGYRTFFAGKWHLGGEGSWPTDHGFEQNKGGWDVGGPRGGYFAPWQNPNLEPGPDGESLTIRLARETEAFIGENADTPFFAFLSFYTVHGPIQTTEALWRKYRDKAHAMGPVDERFVFDRRLPVRTVQDCPIYAGMIETMDDAVGIVLDALDAHGLADNTIVCFTSDNGGVSSGDAFSTSNLPLRGGKGRQWEGGIRVPAYIRGPGVADGLVTRTPLTGADWYPTLLDLAGLPTPEGQRVEGVSLAPLLAQGGPGPDRPLFFHYPHYGNQGGEPSSMVIDGPDKLILYHEDGRAELYDLRADPGEQTDLAPSRPEQAAALRATLERWLDSVHAAMPTPDPRFDAEKRARRWQRLAGPFMDRLETQHAGYLDEGYSPNNNWWQSAPPDAP
jgi:arylsulfatase A-like enzyme